MKRESGRKSKVFTKDKKEQDLLKVSRIDNGTVIDHIPSQRAMKVARILGLSNLSSVVSIGINITSRRMGKKDIVKIEDRYLTGDEANRIALIAPDATINRIKNARVVSKKKVRIQRELVGIIRCSNPICITNHESIDTRFHLISVQPLKARCHYCERPMEEEDVLGSI